MSHLFVGCLEDEDLLELSTRFTNETDLQRLGVKVLKIEGYTVDTAVYNRRNDNINNAALDILKTWRNSNNLLCSFGFFKTFLLDYLLSISD